MKITQRNGRAAFTLIELMAVITIIVILAGLVVGGLGFVSERQAKEKAKVQIALLSKALEEYKLDMGAYPVTVNITGNLTATGGGSKTSSLLYDALFYEGYLYTRDATPPAGDWVKTVGSNTQFPKATKIYLPELNPITSKQGWTTTTGTTPTPSLPITDPWGGQYCYRTAISLTEVSKVQQQNDKTQNPDFDLWSMGKDGKSNATDPSLTTPASGNTNVDDIRNF